MNSDSWSEGEAYEAFMGRWSRSLAKRFLEWFASEPGLRWLDLGCGTGALTSAILRRADPASVLACDPSESFVAHVLRNHSDSRLTAVTATAENLQGPRGGLDVAASGLVLNFVPEPHTAMKAIRSHLVEGGRVAAYVWDYSSGMKFLRVFWDAAIKLKPRAASFDEGNRFPLCRPEALESLFQSSGLVDIKVDSIEIRTRFRSFDDYWTPFLGGTGPAPSYVASLDGREREALATEIRDRLAPDSKGEIDLACRAWAVAGRAP